MCFQPAAVTAAKSIQDISPMAIATKAIEQKKLPIQVVADAAKDNNINKPSDVLSQGGLGVQILK